MAKQHISGSGIGAYAGVDQGVDFTSKGLIPALAHAVVTGIGPETDIEGQHGSYVIYKITSGPQKGRYVYTAENFTPTVRVGQMLRPGQSIGVNHGITPGGTGIEIGFNNTPDGWSPVAPLGQGSAAHGPTSPGQEMWSFIQAVEKGMPGVRGPLTGDYGASSSQTGVASGGSQGYTPRGSRGASQGTPQEQILNLAQFVLGNNAKSQPLIPQVNPITVKPSLPQLLPPQIQQRLASIFNPIQGGGAL